MLCKSGSKSSLGWGNRPAATHMGKQGLRACGNLGNNMTWSEMLQHKLPFPSESTEKVQPALHCGTGRREQEATASKNRTTQNAAQVTSDLGAEQLNGRQGNEHGIAEVLGAQFASRKEVCLEDSWRQEWECLVINMDFPSPLPRPSLPPASFSKSQTHLSDGNVQSCIAWLKHPRNVTPDKSLLKTFWFTSELLPLQKGKFHSSLSPSCLTNSLSLANSPWPFLFL